MIYIFSNLQTQSIQYKLERRCSYPTLFWEPESRFHYLCIEGQHLCGVVTNLVRNFDTIVPNRSRVRNTTKSAWIEHAWIECQMIERRSTLYISTLKESKKEKLLTMGFDPPSSMPR